MRRQSPVASLLYSHLFPKPGPSDPPNFQTHLARDLIPEIRIETATFYGSLDSAEARYPGLNYCHGPHRMRLGRFPHHARLFKAIDDLGITRQEVMDLVRWEGTLWARQRYERDEAVKVRDTTGDGIVDWVDPKTAKKGRGSGIRVDVQMEVEVTKEIDPMADGPEDGEDSADEADSGDVDMDDEEEEEVDQVGNGVEVAQSTRRSRLNINPGLLAAIAARQQGVHVEIDPEFEAAMKELIESGYLHTASRPTDGPLPPANTPLSAHPTSNAAIGPSAA